MPATLVRPDEAAVNDLISKAVVPATGDDFRFSRVSQPLRITGGHWAPMMDELTPEQDRSWASSARQLGRATTATLRSPLSAALSTLNYDALIESAASSVNYYSATSIGYQLVSAAASAAAYGGLQTAFVDAAAQFNHWAGLQSLWPPIGSVNALMLSAIHMAEILDVFEEPITNYGREPSVSTLPGMVSEKPVSVDDARGEIPSTEALHAVDEAAQLLDLSLESVMRLSGLSPSTYYYWRNHPEGRIRRGKARRLFRICSALSLIATVGEASEVRRWFFAGKPSPEALLRDDPVQESNVAQFEEVALRAFRARVGETTGLAVGSAAPHPGPHDLDVLLEAAAEEELILLEYERLRHVEIDGADS